MNKEAAARNREHNRRFECPTCGAKPGKACILLSAMRFGAAAIPTALHTARVKLNREDEERLKKEGEDNADRRAAEGD